MSVYLAIEFNWNKVGGVFSTLTAAQDWCDRQGAVEPNLMWEVHPFEMDVPISDEDVVRYYEDI